MFRQFSWGRTLVYFLLLFAVALSMIAIWRQAEAQTPRERNFAFEYVTTVKDIPAGVKEFTLWLPIPHDDTYQVISDLRIESERPYTLHTAQYGNKILSVKMKSPQTAGFSVTLRFNAKRREHINPLLSENRPLAAPKDRPDSDMARWLQADRLVLLDDKIKTWAQE